jgi:hypothetical protein
MVLLDNCTGNCIHGEEILCNFENSLSSVYKISASENVEIPPSSEMILLGKIQNGLPHISENIEQ